MYRVINRTLGMVVLPSKEILGKQKSTKVRKITDELRSMERAGLLSIHTVSEKSCCWTKYCVDPLCVKKYDGSPTIIPSGDTKFGTIALSFDEGRDTELCFEIELPPNYLFGSDLKPILDWKIMDCGNYGNVTWVIEFDASNNWIQFKKDTLIYNTAVPVSPGYVTVDLPKISGGGFKYNTLIKGRLIRKGSEDTYDMPAVVPAFSIHYQVENRNVSGTWEAL